MSWAAEFNPQKEQGKEDKNFHFHETIFSPQISKHISHSTTSE